MKKLSIILCCIFIIAFVGLSIFIPSLSKQTAEKKRELARLTLQGKEVGQMTTQLATKSEQIAIIQDVLPQKKDLVKAVQYMNLLAKKHALTSAVHFETEDIVKDGANNPIVPMSITVEGQFANITQFTDALQKGKYFFTITNVVGNATPNIAGVNKVVVKGNLYVYAD